VCHMFHTSRWASINSSQAGDVASLEPTAQCVDALGCIAAQIATERIADEAIAAASKRSIQRVAT
jgi:hypothetical protein